MTPADAGYLTTTEAAALLLERGVKVSPITVKGWCQRGLLKAQRIGGKRRATWLIDRSDLEAFAPPDPKGGRPRTPPKGGEEG